MPMPSGCLESEIYLALSDTYNNDNSYSNENGSNNNMKP